MLRHTVAAHRGAALAATALLGAATPANAADEPYDALPYTPSLDVSAMDRTADPCEDLIPYACGGWKKNNPIPPDQTRWSVYGKLSVGQSALPLGHSRGRGQAGERAHADAAEDRRLLRRVHGRGDHRERGLGAARAGSRRRSPHSSNGRHSRNYSASCICAPRTAGIFFGIGSSRTRGCQQGDRRSRAGGLGLPDRDYYTKDRREVAGDACALRRARREDVRAARRPAGGGEQERGHRDAHRDRARKASLTRWSAAIRTRSTTARRSKRSAEMTSRIRLADVLRDASG